MQVWQSRPLFKSPFWSLTTYKFCDGQVASQRQSNNGYISLLVNIFKYVNVQAAKKTVDSGPIVEVGSYGYWKKMKDINTNTIWCWIPSTDEVLQKIQHIYILL